MPGDTSSPQNATTAPRRGPRWLNWFGPGLLVAATGVGAGDLATGAFTGTELGTAVLWAVIVGAFLKYVINEGLARWQLATGTTFLEGCRDQFRLIFLVLFPLYLLPWTLLTCSALMSACGATAHALFPVFDDPVIGKQVFGVVHSLLGAGLVWMGGFRLFERVMSVCIGVMFVVVLSTAIAIGPSAAEVLTGLFVPRIPQVSAQGLQWTVALMGGVGGTLTILCYAYWIAEQGRRGPGELFRCRIDLASGYLMTAFFGVSMVIIGSRVETSGSGSALIVDLADTLGATFTTNGETVRLVFLIGAWAAVFSSLLGVWQSVPYLFADYCRLREPDPEKRRANIVDTTQWPYRGYLLAMATLPAAGLWLSFKEVQKGYALFGAGIIPLLSLTLLILNGRKSLVGEHSNRPLTTIVLVIALAFFAWAGVYEAWSKWG